MSILFELAAFLVAGDRVHAPTSTRWNRLKDGSKTAFNSTTSPAVKVTQFVKY